MAEILHPSLVTERVGFEPTVPLRVQRFSRPPDSTTLAPLQAFRFELSDLSFQLSSINVYWQCLLAMFTGNIYRLRCLKNVCINSRQASVNIPEVTSTW